MQVNQRPTFLIQNSIGDRVVISGLARVTALAAALDEVLTDETAYASWKVHFGDVPTE
jgi:predicted DsbA family dithiol-disulfide isomerase